LYEEVAKRHSATFELITTVRDSAQQNKLTNGEMTDIVYILRKTAELVDDMRAYLDGTGAHIGRITCVKWASEQVAALGTGVIKELEGEYARGMPDNSLSVKLPKKEQDPEGYKKLLIALGVDPARYDEDTADGLRPHWPSITAIAGDRVARGLQSLPGIDITNFIPRNILKTRAKKNGKALPLAIVQTPDAQARVEKAERF